MYWRLIILVSNILKFISLIRTMVTQTRMVNPFTESLPMELVSPVELIIMLGLFLFIGIVLTVSQMPLRLVHLSTVVKITLFRIPVPPQVGLNITE